MAFSPENLKIWVDSRKYLRQIQTATYPPFTKGIRKLLDELGTAHGQRGTKRTALEAAHDPGVLEDKAWLT